MTNEELQLVTNSSAKDFRACNRLYHLRHNLGYRPIVESETTRFGSLMHYGLEGFWVSTKEGLSPGHALESAIAALRQKASDPVDLAKCEALMLGYFLRWGREQYEVLEVEVEFRCELVNPATGAPSRTFELAGKLDAIVKDRQGRVLIVEHKTSAEDIGVGSEYWRRLTLDAQISTYFRGARSLGYDVEGCLYDVIGKPRHQLLSATPEADRKYTKKTGSLYAGQRASDETIEEFTARLHGHIAENPDKYFQRGDVTRLAEQEEDAAYDTWQTARNIRDAQNANRHPKNPDSCLRFGRTCSYFDACCGIASLDDPTKFEKVDDLHPELLQVHKKPRAA